MVQPVGSAAASSAALKRAFSGDGRQHGAHSHPSYEAQLTGHDQQIADLAKAVAVADEPTDEELRQ
jgi:hypothetical protein